MTYFDDNSNPYLAKLDQILANLQYLQEEPFYAIMKQTFANLDNICGHVMAWMNQHIAAHYAEHYDDYNNDMGGYTGNPNAGSSPSYNSDYIQTTAPPYMEETTGGYDVASQRIRRLIDALSRVKRQAGRPNSQDWSVVTGVCYAYEHLKYSVHIPEEQMDAYQKK